MSDEKSPYLFDIVRRLLMVFFYVSVFYSLIFFLQSSFESYFLSLFQPSPISGFFDIFNSVTQTKYFLIEYGAINVLKHFLGFSGGVYLLSLFIYISEIRKDDRKSKENKYYGYDFSFYTFIYLVSSIVLISITLIVPALTNLFDSNANVYSELKSVFYFLPIIWLIISFIYSEEGYIPGESMWYEFKEFIVLGIFHLLMSIIFFIPVFILLLFFS